MKLRLIDADKLLTKAQDYGEGQEKLILIDPYYVKKAETVQAIPILDNATNGDMIKAMFPNAKTWEITVVNITYVCVAFEGMIEIKKFTLDWWNAPYKRGN